MFDILLTLLLKLRNKRSGGCRNYSHWPLSCFVDAAKELLLLVVSEKYSNQPITASPELRFSFVSISSE